MKEIIAIVEKEEVQDIFNIGYIDDDDEIKVFVPSLNIIFLEFETKYLRIKREQTENFEIDLKLIEKKKLFKEVANYKFDNYEVCISSLLGMFLYENRTNNFIEKMEMYVANDEAYHDSRVKCIGFKIGNNSYLFFDPLNWNNMEIGKSFERNIWFEEIPKRKNNETLRCNSGNLIFKSWTK